MARFNEINVGRYNRALQKLFGMKGEASVPILGSEITPSIVIPYGVENRYLEQWNRFGVAMDVTATAGNQSTFRIRNPAGSNVIAVVEMLSYAPLSGNDSGFLIQFGQGGANLSTLPLARALDGRSQTLRPNLIVSSDVGLNASQIGTTILEGAIVQNTTFQFISNENQEMPLAPGDTLQVAGGSNALRIACSLIWRERFLEESERT